MNLSIKPVFYIFQFINFPIFQSFNFSFFSILLHLNYKIFACAPEQLWVSNSQHVLVFSVGS